MTIQSFPLAQVLPNPFQTREKEDPEHIEKIMKSIKEAGLLQIPVGRLKGEESPGLVQLAFGHSRIAAYRELNLTEAGFETFPVDVRWLTDQQMFELAVRENRDRKDLSPIEEAKAMLIYRQQFGKKSAEIGELFQLSDSAVRNRMRLLDLPTVIQEMVGKGISEGTARKLLVLQKITKEEVLVELANKIADPKEHLDTTEAVDREINGICSQSAYSMWSHWSSGEPRGGQGLWLLTWLSGIHAEKITLAKYRGVLKKKFDETLEIDREDFERMLFKAETQPAEAIEEVEGISLRQAEVLINLVNPPACSECLFHLALEGNHYCGLKDCWERKKETFVVAELKKSSRKTKIPIYDPLVDGKARPLQYWQEKDKKLWEGQSKDLRLQKSSGQSYHTGEWSGSAVVEVVDVSPKTQKALAKEEKAKENAPEEDKKYKAQRELENQLKELSEQFVHEVAAPVFSQVLEGIKLPVLEWIWNNGVFYTLDKLPEVKKERAQKIRAKMMEQWLENDIPWEEKKKGPQVLAKYLRGLAKSLGIELPADWMEKAEEMNPARADPAQKSGKATKSSGLHFAMHTSQSTVSAETKPA
jgi:ParB family chromosome partitioning protein